MINSEQFQNDKFTQLIRIIKSSDFSKIVKSAVSEYVQSSKIEKDDEESSALGEDQWFGFTDDLKFGIFDFDFESDKITYQHLSMPVEVSEMFGFRIQKDTPVKIKEVVKKYRKLVDEINSSFLELGDNGLAFVNGLCPLENVIYSPQALEDAVESHYNIPVWTVDDVETFVNYIDENWNNLTQPEKDVRIFLTIMLKQRHQFQLEDYQKVTDKFTAQEIATFYTRFTTVVSFETEVKVIPQLFSSSKMKELLEERAVTKSMTDDDLEFFGLGNFFSAWSEGSGQELPSIKMLIDDKSDIPTINHQLKSLGKLASSIPSNLFNIEVVITPDDNTIVSLLNNEINIKQYFDSMKELARNLTFVVSEDTVSKLRQMQQKFEEDCEKWFTQAGKEKFEKIMNPNLIVLNQFLQQNQNLVEIKHSEEVNDEAEIIKAGSADNEAMPAKFVVE